MKRKALLTTNLSILLFSLAGIFARFLTIPAIVITFGRVFFSSMTLLIVSRLKRIDIKIDDRKDFFLLIIGGIFLALHWWTFLYSIQISSVAIGTITFSSFPLFVTLLEPIFFKEKLEKKDILLCLFILLGVFIITPLNDFKGTYFLGLVTGMISSFLYALISLFNRFLVTRHESTKISLYEQSSAMIFLLPITLMTKFTLTVTDISALMILGIFSTALGHTLYISSLKYISGHIAGMISSLESVYAMILAILIYQEYPFINEIIGAMIILSTTIIAQYKNRGEHNGI